MDVYLKVFPSIRSQNQFHKSHTVLKKNTTDREVFLESSSYLAADPPDLVLTSNELVLVDCFSEFIGK